MAQMMAQGAQQDPQGSGSNMHVIDSCSLQDPDGTRDPWIGRGSFGVVKLQVYRGISVAVKALT